MRACARAPSPPHYSFPPGGGPAPKGRRALRRDVGWVRPLASGGRIGAVAAGGCAAALPSRSRRQENQISTQKKRGRGKFGSRSRRSNTDAAVDARPTSTREGARHRPRVLQSKPTCGRRSVNGTSLDIIYAWSSGSGGDGGGSEPNSHQAASSTSEASPMSQR